MRHAGVWLALGLLWAWGVRYRVFVLWPGQLLVLLPGTYSQAWDMGASISEEHAWANAALALRAAAVLACTRSCRYIATAPEDLMLLPLA